MRPGSSTSRMLEQPAAPAMTSSTAGRDAALRAPATARSKMVRMIGSIPLVGLEGQSDGGKEPAELRPGLLIVSVGEVGIIVERHRVDPNLGVDRARSEGARLGPPEGGEVGARQGHRAPAGAHPSGQAGGKL